MIKLNLLFFFLVLVACQTNDEPEANTAQELLSKAERQSQRGYHLEAVETLSKLKHLHPYSDLGSQADLLRADMAFQQSEWRQAERAYKNFQALYPFHKEKERAHFRQILSLNHQIPKIATRDISLSNQILKVIANFEKTFPKSSYKEQVLEIKKSTYNKKAEKEFRVASFYFKKKKYKAALERLDQVFKNFKKSDWIEPSAHLGVKIAEILEDEPLKNKFLKTYKN